MTARNYFQHQLNPNFHLYHASPQFYQGKDAPHLVSLASIFFPYFVQPILYLLCGIFSMEELLPTPLKMSWKLIQSTLLQTLQVDDRQVRPTSAAAHWVASNSYMDKRNILPT
ncbi:hypothetical protein P3X46_020201 [Hevea brasiliensis]|uniref:Uncharacterized protein n=1 Tax=Hevea brasiliensis TaxID=3981 RepID=A0ABQ9LL60_HEVBR|nr:hypothetical protein P3X46_020201 [Hevea brasiliensis]